MKNNVKYISTQGLFWMMYCITNGYAIYYLSEQGYSTMVIGYMTTVFCALAALLGPVAGKIADKKEGGWKAVLIFLIALSVGANVLLLLPVPSIAKALIFGVANICASCIMPLVNQISFYYTSRGEKIDFGKARGMGSLAYAIASECLGQLTLHTGSSVIAVSGIIVSTIMIAVVFLFPIRGYKLTAGNEDINGSKTPEEDGNGLQKDTAAAAEERINPAGEKTKKGGFISEHRYFLLIWLFINMLLVMHMMTNNYMLYICGEAGGNSASMGSALAIAAVSELPVMFIFNKLIERFSSIKLLMFASVFFCIKSVLYCVGTDVGNIWIIYASQVLQMLSYAVYVNASVYFTDEQMDEKDKSLGQSIMSCTMIIGQVIGNLIGGTLIESQSAHSMCIAGLVICICGSVLLIISGTLVNRRSEKARL